VKLENVVELKEIIYWLRLSRPASMYMVSSVLVGRGLRLQIPDVSPATVAGRKERIFLLISIRHIATK
jgi:hypothetical protein